MAHKKTIVLSDKMEDIKYRIKKAERETSMAKELHERGQYANTVLGGFGQVQGFFSSIFSQSKQLPVIGFIIQMVAVIPAAITTLVDKDKTLGEKLFALGVLLVVTTLSIAAFLVTATISAIIGVAVGSLTLVLEGVGLASSIAAKLQTKADYQEKKEFNRLLQEKNSTQLSDDKYLDPLRVRYLELNNALCDKDLDNDKRDQYQEELTFIQQIIIQKNVPLEGDELSNAGKLKKLYKKRWEKILELTEAIKKLDQAGDQMNPDEKQAMVISIDDLKEAIVKLDTEIADITKPIERLKYNDLLANEKIAQTYTTFALAGAGVVLSTIGLMMTLSVVAAPPILLPIVAGLGIAMATLGLIKWVAEKFAEKQDAQTHKERMELKEEGVLDECLDCYQIELGQRPNQTAGCSYSDHMGPIMQSKPQPQPQPITAPTLSSPEPLITDTNNVVEPNPVEQTVIKDANAVEGSTPSAGSSRRATF